MPLGVEHFRQIFTNLHCQVSAAQWPQSPGHRAPYKPLLLLALLDVLDAGRLSPGDLIAVEDLAERFLSYCDDLAELGWKTEHARIVYPSFHLRFDGFWHLVAKPGREATVNSASGPTSFGTWDRSIEGVTLDAELAALLVDRYVRSELRRALLTAYFGRVERARLEADEGVWSSEDVSFSHRLQELLRTPFSIMHPAGELQTITRPVRDRVFRLWVVPAYDHTCAFCGLRVLTPEGLSAAEAAHIVEHSLSNNDDPRNGLSLCGVHHWAFDNGLLAVSSNNEILLSKVVARRDERTSFLTEFRGRQIHLPNELHLRPSAEALAWHRERTFRAPAA